MAALTANFPTLLDVAKRMDPNGSIAAVAEILNETNEVLDDMPYVEGNLPTGHRSTIRTGIPAPTWRKLYGGVQPTKSTTAQVTDNCGMLEAYAEIDARVAELNGNTAAWRLSEERAFVEGLSQEHADTLFYGNEGTEPEAFTGFAPRLNSLSASNAENILDAGGTGTDNASIYLIGWSTDKVFGIYPKGSSAGLKMEDKGKVTIEDASGGSNTGRMEAYRSHYAWDCGLCVRDWRYTVRIANIDKSLLSMVYTAGAFSSGADLPDLLFQAMRRIPNLAACRPAFYASRDIVTWIGRQTAAKLQGSTLSAEMVGGKLVERFHGIPVRRVDALSADEARVT